MPGLLAAAMAPTTPAAPSGGGGDSFFGIHLPNLGLGQLPGMVGGAVSGLWNMATTPIEGAVTGNWTPARKIYAGAGGGVVSGLYNTASHIVQLGADAHVPLVSPALHNLAADANQKFANWYAQKVGGTDAQQQAVYNSELQNAGLSAYQHAFVPTLINDVGSVATVGQAGGALAKLGDVGEAANATVAAENAAKAGFTAEDIANATEKAKMATPLQRATSGVPILQRFTAGDLASMPSSLREAATAAIKGAGADVSPEAIAARAGTIRNFESLASPVKAVMERAVSPLARAASASNIADVADHVGQAAPEATAATEAAPAAEAAAEVAAEPRIGNKERALQYRNAQPVPQWAQDVVSHVPQPVRDALSAVESVSQARGLKAVAREQRRFVESARRTVLYGPAMKDAVDAASDIVRTRSDELGHTVRPAEASGMIGEEIINRLAGQAGMAARLKEAFPEASELIDKAMTRGGGVPRELMTPELEAKISAATSQFADLAQQRLETLLNSRKGEQGLEAATSDHVTPTTAQAREAVRIQRESQAIDQLGPRRAAELERVRAQIGDVSGRIGRAADEHGRLQQLIQDNRLKVATDVAERPDLFDPSKGINFLGDKSVAQIAQQLKQRVGETPAQLKARAVRVGRGIERDQALADRASRLVRQGSSLDKAQSDLYETLRGERTPTAIAITKRGAALRARAGRLADSLEHPTISQVPGAWKPLWGSFQALRDELGKDPAGAAALAAMPEKFSEVVAKAKEFGLDPAHVSSLTEDQVRRLVNDPVSLFSKGRDFQTVTSGTRKVRRGAQVRTSSLEALAAAQVDVVHEAASNEVVSYIEQHVARPVIRDPEGNAFYPKGWVPWDAEKSHILNGKELPEGGRTVAAGQAQADLMVPVSVQRAIRNMSNDYSHSMWTNLGKITNPWRALVLTYSPGWYLKHFIGHAVLATTQGVRLADWAAAWQAARPEGASLWDRAMQYVTEHGGYKPGDVAPEGVHGVGGVSIYSDLTGEPSLVHGPNSIRGQVRLAADTAEGSPKLAGLKAAVNQVQRRMQRVNEVGDNIGRAAMYLSQRRAGVSEEFALQKSVEALVDYQDLTPFERNVVRSFVPFYAFQKGMFKIMARLPIDHPVTAMAGIQLARLNNDLNPGLPGYYSGMIHVPGTGLNINTRSFDPFADATSLATPQGVAQGMNPFIEIAMRNALGAPVNPASKRYRVDEFGHAVPDTAPAAELAGIFTGVPIATSATGLAGAGTQASKGTERNALKLGGVSTYSDADLQALATRLQKAQLVTQTGNPYVKLPNAAGAAAKYTGPGAQFVNAPATGTKSAVTGTTGATLYRKARRVRKGAHVRISRHRTHSRRPHRPHI